MQTFFIVIHVLLSVFMIFVILLQPGKDAGMGSALGGGSATSAFGGRGAVTVLSKVTGVCAALFFITSLGLSFVGMRASVAGTGLQGTAAPTPTTLPTPENAAPTAPAPSAVESPTADVPPTSQPTPAAPATPAPATTPAQ